ncbi:hypothetical protein BDK51DRAFT_28591 [Blyttiomyces helicus]|uniref:Uncharacterized protein n=1 Tax=Blyttiomyces helicus TaxID=388810 RepID=A0A4V1ISI0_9FUNG|nr:hypothetical protein BDK51DRAFT_28591 [Blyttiomyces helicus]|eukprot:RKO93627.1 hypothetical protein BDK51DRAFT_28591 [Blyttiomyces helicus]
MPIIVRIMNQDRVDEGAFMVVQVSDGDIPDQTASLHQQIVPEGAQVKEGGEHAIVDVVAAREMPTAQVGGAGGKAVSQAVGQSFRSQFSDVQVVVTSCKDVPASRLEVTTSKNSKEPPSHQAAVNKKPRPPQQQEATKSSKHETQDLERELRRCKQQEAGGGEGKKWSRWEGDLEAEQDVLPKTGVDQDLL